MKKDYAIHWFRRDLRVAGNSAFQQAYSQFGENVIGVFFFDSEFLGRNDFSHNRFQFFIHTMEELKQELQAIGSDLLVLDIVPEKGFTQLFNKLKKKPSAVFFNRDYEPFALKRDQKVQKILKKNEIACQTYNDHLIIEPNQLSKKDGSFYKVYTPFSRRWLEIFSEDDFIQTRIKNQKKSFTYLNKLEKGDIDKIYNLTWTEVLNDPVEDKLDYFKTENSRHVDIEIPKAGSVEAFKQLKEFKKKVEDYHSKRDFPIQKATSSLSHFLKNGSLTTTQIISYLGLQAYDKKKSGTDVYFSELIWREFYYHVLFHFPDNEKESFLKQYLNLKWENNQEYFEAWKEGRTGFPIVDAGMRELNTTGFMHNRVRMIVASFLTKDLLIDWRLGEQYFMEKLLDGDLAANNGGWQWAASTGCDPQPYFRIFNPWLQSKKFDANGAYIKKFIPELSNVEAKKLHAPILDHPSYPAPIVEHSIQRDKALLMYKAVRS